MGWEDSYYLQAGWADKVLARAISNRSHPFNQRQVATLLQPKTPTSQAGLQNVPTYTYS